MGQGAAGLLGSSRSGFGSGVSETAVVSSGVCELPPETFVVMRFRRKEENALHRTAVFIQR